MNRESTLGRGDELTTLNGRSLVRWLALACAVTLVACSSGDDDGAAGMPGGGGAGSAGSRSKSDSGAGHPDSGTPTSDSGTSGTGGMSGTAIPPGAAGWQAFMDLTPADRGLPDRGKYLVDNVLVCGVCHTPSLKTGEPDMTMYLAGSRSYDFEDVDGTIITVNAENLTSHIPEGLGTWTDGQIRTAVTKGVDDEHYAIYPIMPYPEYSMLTDEDIDSVIQYLLTVPANDNVVASDYPHPDLNPPAPLVDESKVPHTTLDASDPDYESAERGRYLASVACLNCHTEEVKHDDKIAPDVPNLTKAFGGGKRYTFIRGAAPNTSTNLTPDATGLADWTVDDIVAAIKTNKEKDTGRTFCNTHPGGPERLGGMTDEDALDIANYLHTLPPVQNGPFTCVE